MVSCSDDNEEDDSPLHKRSSPSPSMENSIPIEDPHQSLYWYDGEKAYNPQKKMPTNS